MLRFGNDCDISLQTLYRSREFAAFPPLRHAGGLVWTPETNGIYSTHQQGVVPHIMKSNNDAASVKGCARKIWAHTKIFVASVKSDLKETRDEMFEGADTPKERLQRSIKHGLLLLAQLCLIMGVYAAGCALASVLPIALPGNIMGMVLLLVLLGTHILKTKYISEACDYLIDNMSVFFIPAGVAIMGCFSMLENSAAKFAFVCIATTVIVFLATSYTVLFVSWIMAKLGKDTALAPAVEAQQAASADADAKKSQASAANDSSKHAEAHTKHHPHAHNHTPGAGIVPPVTGKEA